jgi:uncharacterized membrane protein
VKAVTTTQDDRKGKAGEKADQNGHEVDGFGELREEFMNYLTHITHEFIEKAEDKVGGLAGKLTDSMTPGEGEGGTAMKAGMRALKGENPLKAFVGEKAKGMKDKVVGRTKDIVPGMSNDDESEGGSGGGGAGNVKSVNIIESVDVPVPIRTVYDQWTELEDFGSFTKGVQGVDKKDDVTTSWRAKIMWSNRSWTATVQEQVPDERIRWTSEGAKGSTEGVVTFHELAPSLTRIVVVVEYTPSGFFEKTGNIWRAQGRRLRLDLKHFARQVTLHVDEDLEGWRGEIRDGEVVRSHEEGLEDDQGPEDEEYEDEYEEDGEGEEEEEPEDEDEDEYEDEDEEEDEDEDDEDDEDDDEEEDEEEDDRR